MVAETLLPATNGVVNSVLRVADELAAVGYTTTVLAPAGAPASITTRTGITIEVRTVPAVELPGYRGLRVARPGVDLRNALRELRPDVVHLASPLVLGPSAALAARALDIPAVSVFQTDLSGFLRRYRLAAFGPLMWSALRRIHGLTDLTLAPSTTTSCQLRAHGIDPVSIWGRGVDGLRFDPRFRSEQLRAGMLDGKRLLVGFVERLAPEKRCDLLASVSRLPDVQLVMVGDGPQRAGCSVGCRTHTSPECCPASNSPGT